MFSYVLRFTLAWLNLFVLIQESRSDANIVFKKPVLTITRYPDYSYYFNDESNRTCMELDNKKMVVYDLLKVYEIKKIVIHNGKYRSKVPAYIYLGNEYQPCNFQNQIKDYSKCSEFFQNDITTEIQCPNGLNTGRYLVLLKGDVFVDEIMEVLGLCEIRAYGDEVDDIEVSKRPEIRSEKPPPPITIKDFKIAPEIRKNVLSLPIPRYANGLVYINENCEPIIYSTEAKLAFGIACQTSDHKGRFVAFGKEDYFQEVFTDPTMSQFKANLQNWMSPNVKNASYVLSTTIKTMQDFHKSIKPGIIVYFKVSDKYSDEIIDNLKSCLLNGTISLALDLTFWNADPKKPRDIYLRFLNVFNVDFVKQYISWSSAITNVMPDSIYNEELIGTEEKIRRMSLDHEYMTSNADSFTAIFSKYPSSLLRKSKISVTLKAILAKYQDLLKWICPCALQGATDKNDRTIIRFIGEIMKNQLLVNSGIKAPCVELFPGDFKSPPPKHSVKLNLLGVTSSTNNPIGYYLEAGGTLDYTVIESSGVWKISVGCHSDTLPDDLNGWLRYPNIYVGDIVLEGSGQVFSPFGGVLWLMNDVVNASITLTLSNVIRTPFFNLREKNPVAHWEDQNRNPGLWAQIAGDSHVICEASFKVNKFTGPYLESLMKNTWDPMVRMEDVMTVNDWKIQRPEITILDMMISFGYGHSGYPIEVYSDWYTSIFNATYIKVFGSWGMCHEIGHNLQRNKWTFTGTTDVTNNIFCLFVFDKLFKLPRYGLDSKNLESKKTEITNYLDNWTSFEGWKDDPWVGLVIYTQFVHHFGWGFYKKGFEYYEKNSISPSTDEMKMETFMNVSSLITGQNLIPLFDFWGFTIPDKLIGELSKLPCFFPENDYACSMSTKRSKYIKDKYPNCNTKSLFFQDFEPAPLIQGIRPNFINEIQRKQMK